MPEQNRSCLICGPTSRKTFWFPQGTTQSEIERCQRWLNFANKFNPPADRLNMKRKCLCQIHFTERNFRNPVTRKLLRNAIPTLSGEEASPSRVVAPNPDSQTILDDTMVSNVHYESGVGNDQNVSVTSETQPLLRQLVDSTPDKNKSVSSSYFGKYISKKLTVLADKNFKDRLRLKSGLDKVNLKRMVSVPALQLKKNIKILNQDQISSLIESMPQVAQSHMDRLSVLKNKKLGFQKLAANKSFSHELNSPQSSVAHNLFNKNKKIFNVSPGLHVKIDGMGSSANISDTSLFDKAENVFSVSTILSNVNDKSQMESLCQLVIESVFRLKNVNVGGTASKLEIYLCQDSSENSNFVVEEDLNYTKLTSGSDAPSTARNNKITQDFDNFSGSHASIQDVSSTKTTSLPHASTSVEVTNDRDGSLNAELSMSSGARSTFNKTQSQISSKKHFKVNLNFHHDHSYLSKESHVLFEKPPYFVKLINVDTYRSSSKKTRILKQPFPMTKKVKKEFSKLRDQINRLKDNVKKKNNNINKMNEKLKYLRKEVCKEKGLKQFRFPRSKTADSENLFENAEVTSANNNKKEVPVKKKKIVSTSKSDSSIRWGNYDSTFDDKLDYFYETYLEDCIEKG